MNMKKTMAAIAAGAVAVSAMATTVSAEDAKATWGDKVVSFNLVQAVESKSYTAKLHIEQTNIRAEVGDFVRIHIPNIGEDDVITVNGEYANNNSMTFKPMTFNWKNGSAAARAALKGKDTAGSYIEIPVVDANTNAAFTIKGVSGATASSVTVAGKTVAADTAGTGTVTLTATGEAKIKNAMVGMPNGTYRLVATSATAYKVYSAGTDTGITLSLTATTDIVSVKADDTAATIAADDIVVINYVDSTQVNDGGVNLYIDIEKKLPDNTTITDNDKAMAATRTAGGALEVTLEVGSAAAGNAANTKWVTSTGASLNVAATVDESKKVKLTPYATNYFSGTMTGLGDDGYGTMPVSGNALSHVFEAKFDGTNNPISATIVSNIINDAINHYGNVTFKFNAASKPVDIKNSWNYGNYSEDWMTGDAKKDYSKFDKNWWDLTNGQYAFDAQNYWINDWSQMNLFKGALVINSDLTFSLATAESLAWNGTSLTFDWDDIQANALNPNAYTNYINQMVLRTGTLWFWESFDLILAEGEAENVDANAPDAADPGEIEDEDDDESDDLGDGDDEDDDDGEEDDGEEDDGEEDDGEEDDGEDDEDGGDVDNDTDVSSPKTGNPAVALAVIPVALAAAAVVAKKRG